MPEVHLGKLCGIRRRQSRWRLAWPCDARQFGRGQDASHLHVSIASFIAVHRDDLPGRTSQRYIHSSQRLAKKLHGASREVVHRARDFNISFLFQVFQDRTAPANFLQHQQDVSSRHSIHVVGILG